MLTQLRNENIFDLRREFNKKVKQNPLKAESIKLNILNSLEMINITNLIPSYFKDQDGYYHLVFIDDPKMGKDHPKYELFKKFYNFTYLSGEICRNTDDLIMQKECLQCHLEGYEHVQISFITVISLLSAYNSNELSVMVRFQHWLHSTKK